MDDEGYRAHMMGNALAEIERLRAERLSLFIVAMVDRHCEDDIAARKALKAMIAPAEDSWVGSVVAVAKHALAEHDAKVTVEGTRSSRDDSPAP